MLHTDRLKISELSYDDSEFIFALLNEPAFIRYIGDRNIRTLADARAYLRKGPIDSYATNGFGLFMVSLREDAIPVGICGLVERDHLEHPDLGFAFLEKHWSNGYAYESSLAVIEHARAHLGHGYLLAIVNEDNDSSIGLLKKLGFRFEKMVLMPGEAKEICQYVLTT